MQLKYIEPIMGMFHLMMAILQQLYRIHFGKEKDSWSLRMWMDELGKDYRKMWDDSQKGPVKDFHASRDALYIVLKGYVLASVGTALDKDCSNLTEYSAIMDSISRSRLTKAIEHVAEYCCDFQYVHKRRSEANDKRNPDRENMILFLQHGLILRVFDQAVRAGDSGLMCAAISFFTVWLQGTGSANYKCGLLRLTAQLRGIWSERLQKFWMENCLVNLSGKRNAFMPLDQLNEYIVREVKNKMQPYMTEQTDDYLRNKMSLLTMFFWEVRRKFADETDADIFDFHSSSVDEWNDIRRVVERVLDGELMNKKGRDESRTVTDIFMEGIGVMADGETIAKVKKSLLKPANVFDDVENLGEVDQMGEI
jgi:hypothetical protein